MSFGPSRLETINLGVTESNAEIGAQRTKKNDASRLNGSLNKLQRNKQMSVPVIHGPMKKPLNFSSFSARLSCMAQCKPEMRKNQAKEAINPSIAALFASSENIQEKPLIHSSVCQESHLGGLKNLITRLMASPKAKTPIALKKSVKKFTATKSK